MLCCGQVAELVVDNCVSGDGEVEGLTDEYAELEILSMVNAGLTSLSKLPPLPKLRKVSRAPPVPTIHHATCCSLDVCVCVCPAGGERQRHRGRPGRACGEMSQPDVPEPEREQDQRAERHRGSGESTWERRQEVTFSE